MDTKSLLLTTALRHRINEPNIEAGFDRFRVIAGGSVDYRSFCDAVAACLRDRLIREPIRLPEGRCSVIGIGTANLQQGVSKRHVSCSRSTG